MGVPKAIGWTCRRWSCVIAVAILGAIQGCASGMTSSGSLLPQPTTSTDPEVLVGDVLEVTVWRQPELSGTFRVTADGNLPHPLYQSVQVANLRLSAVRDRLLSFLLTYEQNPQLVVELLARVTVGGEVQRPDVYTLPRETTIGQAIAEAGGVTARGRLDRVRVVRDGRSFVINLLTEGAPSGALPIKAGDEVFVTRRSDVNGLIIFQSLVSLAGASAALIIAFTR